MTKKKKKKQRKKKRKNPIIIVATRFEKEIKKDFENSQQQKFVSNTN